MCQCNLCRLGCTECLTELSCEVRHDDIGYITKCDIITTQDVLIISEGTNQDNQKCIAYNDNASCDNDSLREVLLRILSLINQSTNCLDSAVCEQCIYNEGQHHNWATYICRIQRGLQGVNSIEVLSQMTVISDNHYDRANHYHDIDN